MPRIPLFPLESMTQEQRRAYEAVSSGRGGPVRGPTAAVLHNPDLAEKWRALGDILRYKTSLELRLSELAILVTARRWTAQFPWSVHEKAAREAGLPQPVIDAIRSDRRPPAMSAEETAIYEFAHALAGQGSVPDAAYQRALERFGVAGVVELTAIVGYYSMVAMTVNAHQVPVPDGSTPLVPRAE